MNPPTSPAVITSRRASRDLDKIRANHTEIITGLATHNARIGALNDQKAQQRAADMQTKQTMQHEIQKQQMTETTTAGKNAMDFASKQAETDVKRAALSIQ